MTKRMLFAGVALVLGALTLAGCNEGTGGTSTQPHALAQFDAKASFFDGAVSATYSQNRGSRNDFVAISFYAPGKYVVTFSTPPSGRGNGAQYMPANFTQEITAAGGPRELVIRQYQIPDYVRITIVGPDGKTEFHDFD